MRDCLSIKEHLILLFFFLRTNTNISEQVDSVVVKIV